MLTLEELLASNEALPSIPKVIALLLNELDQDEPDLRKISQLINTDPILATRLLRLANSAQFQFANKISSVSEALALMGWRPGAGRESVRGSGGGLRVSPT